MSNVGIDARRELSGLESSRPELSAWLRPLRVALGALDTEPWRSIVPVCSPHRAPDAPLLHEAVVSLASTAAHAHVRDVLRAALLEQHHAAVDAVDSVRLLELAVARDAAAVDEMAAAIGVPGDALNAAAQLAAVPLLIACARGTGATRPLATWTNRYCHVCGSLPLLAEVLGLERARQLRCGRCGAGWQSHVLLCAFCGESDHAKLGSLVPAGAEGQTCWVETCTSCKGYMKTRAGLRGLPAEQVLIEDARTLDLDLVALERGYVRPEMEGFPVRMRIDSRGSIN